MIFFHLEPSFKFKPFLFRPLSLSHSFTFFCLTAVPLCHRRNKGAWERKWQGEKESGAKQGEREGRHCTHLTSSDQNSEVDQVDMKFASNKSPPPPPQALLCLNSLYPWGSYHLSLFLTPASSFHTSSNPSPISPFPLRPRVALCCTLFASYTPLPHSALTCLFHSPAPPSLRPFASSLPATDERRNKWRSAC